MCVHVCVMCVCMCVYAWERGESVWWEARIETKGKVNTRVNIACFSFNRSQPESTTSMMCGILQRVSRRNCTKNAKKSMETLRAWIPCIANHLWWCASTCSKNGVLLKEKWQSVVQHVANKHAWIGEYWKHDNVHGQESRKDNICSIVEVIENLQVDH